MQRDDFNFGEFEQYLQEHVKNHRLYPSENIWQNIDKELHGERQWPLLTLIGLITFVSIISLSISYQPNKSLFTYNNIVKKVDNSSSTLQYQQLNSLKNNAKYFSETENIKTEPEIITINNSEKLNTEIAKIESFNDVEMAINQVSLFNTAIVPKTLMNHSPSILNYSINNNRIVTNVIDENNAKSVDKFLAEQEELISLVSQNSKEKKSKLNFHFYGTPSISYRSLKDEKDKSPDNLTSAAPNLLANYTPTDLDKIIRHTPSMGIEVGAGVSYNVSPRFRIRTGLQFNFREYNLGAYRATTEVATIALVSSSRIDSINSLAFYRTRNGYSPVELKNKYFEVSIPLAFEYDVTNNKNLNFGVAISVQPTYLISRNSFLISTDYKNYTNNPTLVRGWNINSSFEGFVSYKVGDFKWTLGPQIRYQNLPTYTKKYSIREHLIDYGVKIGFSKALH